MVSKHPLETTIMTVNQAIPNSLLPACGATASTVLVPDRHAYVMDLMIRLARACTYLNARLNLCVVRDWRRVTA